MPESDARLLRVQLLSPTRSAHFVLVCVIITGFFCCVMSFCRPLVIAARNKTAVQPTEADIYLIDEPSAYLDVEQRVVAARVMKRLRSNCLLFD